MTLRTRLALLLAALACATAAVVGLVGYHVTSASFRNEIERSLDDYASKISSSADQTVQRACQPRSYDDHDNPYGRRPAPSAAQISSSGTTIGGSVGTSGASSRPATSSARSSNAVSSSTTSVAGKGSEQRRSEPLTRPPSAAILQCIDADGAVVFASRLVDIPVEDRDRVIAATSKPGTRATRTVGIDGKDYFLVTVAMSSGGAVQIAREVTENSRVLSGLVVRFLALVVAATALAALAGALVARRTVQPLAELTATAEDIASHGRLDVALPSPRHDDETGRLAHAFATMVDRLRASKAQQTQLVHDAGHELRTPLTSLRTNIGVLRRHPDLATEKRVGIVADLHAELAELTELVDELVALAADDDANESRADVALDTVVRDVVARWERRGQRSVALRIDAGVYDVHGSERLLARAVSNLVSNAMKFAPAHLPVEVTLTPGRAPGSMILRVRDHGDGIPDSELSKIFDRFYRSTIHRNHPGSGLGLSIVAKVVQDHGGTVGAANAPDGGAVFTILLPGV